MFLEIVRSATRPNISTNEHGAAYLALFTIANAVRFRGIASSVSSWSGCLNTFRTTGFPFTLLDTRKLGMTCIAVSCMNRQR